LTSKRPLDLPALSTGEKIVWQGFPKPGVWFEPADLFAIPFSIFWLGMVLLIFAMTLLGEATDVDPTAYVILPFFVLIGLYFVFGRFIVAMFARKSTSYFLTDRRAIIRSGMFQRSERSVSLQATGEIRLSSIRDGYGTIEFGQSNPFYRMMPRSWGGQFSALAPAFEKVSGAEDVYRLIINLQSAAGRV